MTELICPDCGAKMVLRNSEKYGPFYGCTRFPKCQGAHGAHTKTGEPLGIPVNQETKNLRIKAHNKFDRLWKGGMMHRVDAYVWLQNAMHLTKNEAHIGNFSKEQCETLLLLLEENRGGGPRQKTDMELAFECALKEKK